jgi:hypothetical protein
MFPWFLLFAPICSNERMTLFLQGLMLKGNNASFRNCRTWTICLVANTPLKHAPIALLSLHYFLTVLLQTDSSTNTQNKCPSWCLHIIRIHGKQNKHDVEAKRARIWSIKCMYWRNSTNSITRQTENLDGAQLCMENSIVRWNIIIFWTCGSAFACRHCVIAHLWPRTTIFVNERHRNVDAIHTRMNLSRSIYETQVDVITTYLNHDIRCNQRLYICTIVHGKGSLHRPVCAHCKSTDFNDVIPYILPFCNTNKNYRKHVAVLKVSFKWKNTCTQLIRSMVLLLPMYADSRSMCSRRYKKHRCKLKNRGRVANSLGIRGTYWICLNVWSTEYL